MKFTCASCGGGSFTVREVAGSHFATCNTCGLVSPFNKMAMQDDEPAVDLTKTLHLKLVSPD